MSAIASQITSLMIIYSTVYAGADEKKHRSSASLAFVLGIHRWPVNSSHKGPVTRKTFPFDDVTLPQNRNIQLRVYSTEPIQFQGFFFVGLDDFLNKQSIGRWNETV